MRDSSSSLDERQALVLRALDGSKSLEQLSSSTGLSLDVSEQALNKLILIGHARPSSRSVASSEPETSTSSLTSSSSEEPSSASSSEDDLSFGSLSFGPSTDIASATASSTSGLAPLDASSLRASAKERADQEARVRAGSKSLRLASRDANAREIESMWDDAKERAEIASRERAEREARAAKERAEQEARERAERAAEAERQRLEQEKRERQEQERREREARLAREEQERKEREERERLAREKERLEKERLAAIELARLRRAGVIRRRARIASFAAMGACVFGAVFWLYHQAAMLTPAVCSKALSDSVGSPVTVASCSASVLPYPSFQLASVSSEGSLWSAQSISGRLNPLALALGRFDIGSAEARGVKISLAAMASAKNAPARSLYSARSPLTEIQLSDVSLEWNSFHLDRLSGLARFGSRGFERAELASPSQASSHKVLFAVLDGVPSFSIDSKFSDDLSSSFFGFKQLSLTGSIQTGSISVDTLTLNNPSGDLLAKGIARSDDRGSFSAEGSFEARQVALQDLAGWLFTDGLASGTGQFTLSGSDPLAALGSLSMRGSWQARNFALKVDLPEALGLRGAGITRFPEASIQASLDGLNLGFSMPDLSSGPLRAKLDISKSSSGAVSGQTSASLGSIIGGGSVSASISGNAERWGLQLSR